MAFTSGANHVFGDVLNDIGGQLVTTGGATTTYHDDVVHNGQEIRTNADSYSVFLGSVSGAGPLTGLGTVQFEGDLRPGNSPSIVDFEGDVFLSQSSILTIELGGLAPGSGYDQLAVHGLVNLNGLLNIQMLDGFAPNLNDSFTLIDNFGSDSILGNFIGLDEGALLSTGDFGFRLSYSGGTGNDVVLRTISAVPEPSSFAVIACGTFVACVLRRRKRLVLREATAQDASIR